MYIVMTNSTGETNPWHSFAKNDSLLLGATINISPIEIVNRGILTKGKVDWVRWETLTPDEQKAMLARYIDVVYRPLADGILIGYEFCKNLMVHAHMCLFIMDKPEMVSYHLQTARVLTRRSHLSSKVFKSTKYTKHMNYIHTLEQKGVDQWIQYVQKDKGCMPSSINLITPHVI